MPTWSSFDAFARDLSRMEGELRQQVGRETVKEMAAEATRIATWHAQRDTGGDAVMSGWKPAALRTKIKFTKGGMTAVLLPDGKLAAAGWTTVTGGRNAGETGLFLGPGSGRQGQAVRRKKNGQVSRVNAAFRISAPKRWNGVTRGKGTADDANAVMDRRLPPIARANVRKTIVKRFDVT